MATVLQKSFVVIVKLMQQQLGKLPESYFEQWSPDSFVTAV